MIKPKNLPRDSNQRAHAVAQLLTGEARLPVEPERSALSIYFAQIGQVGGLKGGKARDKALSGKRKTQIARKAAQARWMNSKGQGKKS